MFNVSVGATSQKDIDNIYIKKVFNLKFQFNCWIFSEMLYYTHNPAISFSIREGDYIFVHIFSLD